MPKDIKEVMTDAVHLLLRVYSEAFEEYTEEGEDGIALEGVTMDDELYDEIVRFVEEDLSQFVGEAVNERKYAEALRAAERESGTE